MCHQCHSPDSVMLAMLAVMCEEQSRKEGRRRDIYGEIVVKFFTDEKSVMSLTISMGVL